MPKHRGKAYFKSGEHTGSTGSPAEDLKFLERPPTVGHAESLGAKYRDPVTSGVSFGMKPSDMRAAQKAKAKAMFQQ